MRSCEKAMGEHTRSWTRAGVRRCNIEFSVRYFLEDGLDLKLYIHKVLNSVTCFLCSCTDWLINNFSIFAAKAS